MRSTKLLVAAAAALAMIGSTAAGPANTGKPFEVQLQPEQEVAPFTGAEGASGDISLRLNPGQKQICVDGGFDGFGQDGPALAHIHEAPTGDNGPVVVELSGLLHGNTIQGCVEIEREQIRDILTDPADYYLNVHVDVPQDAAPSPDNSPGFFEGVRGQLSR
jgi:hypothetical protein